MAKSLTPQRDAVIAKYLNEAYGKEKQLETALAAQIKLAHRPQLKKGLQDHLKVTKAQARGLKKRIKELGSTATDGPELPGPDVVSAMISRDVAIRVAKQQNVTLPAQLPLDEVAQSLGLPANAEYVKIYGEGRILFNLLLQGAKPAQAGDAELRHVFEVFQATGAMQPGLTFEQFKGSVSEQAIETLGRATTVRKDVEAQLDQLDVRVNPRFGAAEIAVYSEPGPANKPLSLVSVPLADTDSSPVIDPA